MGEIDSNANYGNRCYETFGTEKKMSETVVKDQYLFRAWTFKYVNQFKIIDKSSYSQTTFITI